MISTQMWHRRGRFQQKGILTGAPRRSDAMDSELLLQALAA
jgi:hypothetical protein